MIEDRTKREFVYLNREDIQRAIESEDENLETELISKARKELGYSNSYADSNILETLKNEYRKVGRPNGYIDLTIIEKLVKNADGKEKIRIIEDSEEKFIELALFIHKLRSAGKKPETLLGIINGIAEAEIQLQKLKCLFGKNQVNDIIESKLKNLIT